MPSLLSGGKALKGTYGTSTIFITLPTAQLSLGVTPSTSTGYTLVTGPNGQLGWTSTLGGVYFKDSVIQSQTPNGDITIQSTGTGRLNLNGNVFINGNNALISTSTFIDLTVLDQAVFASTTTNVVFDAGINVAQDVNIQGNLNAFGNVFFEPYNGVVTIRPSGIGTIDIYPETLGAMDNVAIGTRQASSATFTSVNAESLLINGVPVGSGAATISDTPPPSPYVGQLWWDSTVGILRVYYTDGDSGQWVDAFPVVEGPQGIQGPAGPSGTGTGIASVTTSTLFINNSTSATSTSTGALHITGGVGVGGNLYASRVYSAGFPVLTSASLSNYGVSEIIAGSGITTNTSSGVVTISNNDTLDTVTTRNSATTNVITITNQTSATSTTTGALIVDGGVGVAGSIYVGNSLNIMGSDGTHGSISYNDVGDTFEVTGNIVPTGNRGLGSVLSQWNHLYADQIFENGVRVVTSMKPTAGPGIAIQYASTTGPIIAFTITNIGVNALTAGTDTAISYSIDNSLVVWNTSTLETVTSRGATTPSEITITNSGSNALNVSGTINASAAFINGAAVWTTATLTDNNQLTNSIGYLTSSTIGAYGVSYLTAGNGIGLSANTGTITVNNTGVLSANAGSGIVVSTATGNISITSIDTLALVTARGATTPSVISITTTSVATTVTNGALRVVGGVGIGGSLYAGNIYDNGNRVLNKIQINVSPGLSGGGTITGPNATVNLVNTGVITLTADTDTSVTSTTGNIRIWNISTLQSISNRGNQTTNAMRIANSSSSVSTTTGALRVDGGLGVQGSIYASAIFDSNSRVITLATLGNYGVTELKGGPGILVSSPTGIVTLSSTATLALVTSFGSTTPSAITITNGTISTDTNTGALQVAGGVGIGGDVFAGNIYDNNVRVVTSINPQGSTYIGVSAPTYVGPQATFTIDNLGVQSLANGTDTIVSSTTGSGVQVNVNSTLQTVTERGAITGQAIRITNTSSALTPTDGALIVNGGVGIVADLRIGGNVSIAKTLQVTGDVTFNNNVTFNGTATYVLSTNTYYTDNLLELHVAPGGVGSLWSINDGKDIGLRIHYFDSVDKNAALVMANDTRALEWYSVASETSGTISGNYGTFKTGSIQLVDTTSATNTTSGALQVQGGVGIGGNLYTGGTIYVAGSQVITASSLGAYGVTKLNAGPFIGVTPISGTGTVTVTNLGVQTASGSQYIAVSTSTGSVSIVNLGVTNAIGSTYIGVSNGTGTVTITNLGVQSLTAGGETTVSASTGSDVSITVTSTLQDVTSRGTTTTSVINIINSLPAIDTISGALRITGGVGIGGALYVGGNMFAANSQVVTAATIGTFGVARIQAGPAISVDPVGGTGTVTIGNLGVQALAAGTDTAISSTTGTVTVWNNSTLQTITNRGATTNNILQLTSNAASTDTNTGALRVTGGVGVGGNLRTAGIMYAVGAEVITTATLGVFGVRDIAAGTGIFVTPTVGTGSVIVTNIGVTQLTAGTDTAVSSTTGTVTVWNTSTLQTITNRGTTTTNALNFSNNTAATSTASGALQVRGGVGIGGALYVGGIMYASGAQVVTEATLGAYGVTKVQAGSAIAVSPSSGTGTVTVGNLGVHALTAGTDTAISSTTGTVTVWNTSTLQTITNRGAVTNNTIQITNGTISTDTNTGALQVAGGVGIGGNIYAGDKMYAVGAEVVTTATIGIFGVQLIRAGTDTAISISTGTVTIWSTATLQSITNRSNSTTNAISITSTAQSANTNSGQALQVAGGVGVGGNVVIGGNITVVGTINASVTGVTGTITTATNIAGGGDGYIPIQTSAGKTSFISSGTAGQLLQMQTGNTATFISTTTLWVGNAVTATNAQNVIGGTVNATAGTFTGLVSITNGTIASNTYTAALTVGGGIGANNAYFNTLNVTQAATFGGNVTFSGSATYVNSTNTVYTDNIIDLHVPPGGIASQWTTNDGKDIGLRFHYYTNSTDTNAALVLANDTKYLTWFSSGTEVGSAFVGTYGGFKAGAIVVANNTATNSTSSGALQVVGGIGVGGSVYIGGDITVLGTINASVTGVITTASNISGGLAGGIPIQASPGVTSFINAGAVGSILQQQGGTTATFVSTTTLMVGQATTASNIVGGLVNATTGNFSNTVNATSTNSGAVQVVGGVGINKDLYVGGNITVIGTITASITGIASTATNLSGGTVDATTGAFSGIVTITNATAATTTQTGALQVYGGVGVRGNLYAYGKIVGGENSVAAGNYASVHGGLNNSASGNYSAILGGKGATTRGIIGANAWGYNFSTVGDAQQVSYLLGVATTTATPANLTTDQGAAGAANQIIMPNNYAYGFKGMVTARDTTNGWVAVWEIRGGIRRGANAASATLVGTPVIDRIAYDSVASAWTVAVVADTTNGGVQFQVTGAATTNIHWVANMTTIEVA